MSFPSFDSQRSFPVKDVLSTFPFFSPASTSPRVTLPESRTDRHTRRTPLLGEPRHQHDDRRRQEPLRFNRPLRDSIQNHRAPLEERLVFERLVLHTRVRMHLAALYENRLHDCMKPILVTALSRAKVSFSDRRHYRPASSSGFLLASLVNHKCLFVYKTCSCTLLLSAVMLN